MDLFCFVTTLPQILELFTVWVLSCRTKSEVKKIWDKIIEFIFNENYYIEGYEYVHDKFTIMYV